MPDNNLLDDSEIDVDSEVSDVSDDFGTALDMPSFDEVVDEAEQQ